MKINRKKILNDLFIGLIIFILIFYIMITISYERKNSIVILTFILSFLLILFGIFSDKEKFSLNKTYWYFMLFFMFLAPIIQYLTGYNVWNYYIEDKEYIKINLYIIFFNFIYLFIYKINIPKKNSSIKSNAIYLCYNQKGCIILMFLSLICFFFASFKIGFHNFFVINNNSLGIKDNTLNTILTNLIRVIPVYYVAYSIKYYKKEKKGIFNIFISLLLTFLLNYPSSVTRYWLGTVYIGIFLIMFENKIKLRSFDSFIIIIFLLLFPLFQIFKWNSINDLITGNVKLNSFIEAYNNADFDAYSMFARTINYTEKEGFKYGNQVLGSIFFIVPRKFWVSKSLPSGEIVASYQKQNFTNLSCPLLAEGYIDFGFIGLILYAILISLLNNMLDKKYIKYNENSLIKFGYPFYIGLLIFTLRGALHPAIVFTFIFYIPIILYVIYKKLIKKIFNKI